MPWCSYGISTVCLVRIFSERSAYCRLRRLDLLLSEAQLHEEIDAFILARGLAEVTLAGRGMVGHLEVVLFELRSLLCELLEDGHHFVAAHRIAAGTIFELHGCCSARP